MPLGPKGPGGIKIWSYLADLPRLTHMDNSFAIYQDCSLLAPLSTVVYIDKEGTR